MEGDEAMTHLTLVPPLPPEEPRDSGEEFADEFARNMVAANPKAALLLTVALMEALEAS